MTYYKFIRFIAMILGVFVFTNLFSQCTEENCGDNLVLNGDFEISTDNCINDDQGQLRLDWTPVEGWFGTATKAGAQNGVTPDYFHDDCSGNGTNNCGSGTGSVGFFVFVGGGNGREYTQSKLARPLEAGRQYCVELKVKSNGLANDGLGVCIAKEMANIDELGQSYIGDLPQFQPQVEQPANELIDGCTTFSGTFCAKGGEELMIIGNFKTDDETNKAAGMGTGYLIIDEVSVRETCSSNLEVKIKGDPIEISCGESSIIEASVKGGTNIVYEWLLPEGNDLNGAGPHKVTPNITTTYKVVAKMQGVCEDEITDTAEITIEVICGPKFELRDTVICQGGCVEILAKVEGGEPPYRYVWTKNLPNNEGPHNVCPETTTTYVLEVIDANEKSYTDSITVTVTSLSEVSVSSDTVICEGKITLVASGGDSYNWSTGDNTSSIVVEPTVTTTYKVEILKGGCSVIDSVTVMVSCGPSFQLNDTTICQNDCFNLQTKVTGGTTPLKFKWNHNIPSNEGPHKVCPDTDITYVLEVEDADGNSFIDSAIITVIPSPIIDAGEDVVLCGDSVELFASGGDTYVWSTGETTSSIIVKPEKNTKYIVTGYTGQCKSSDTVIVMVSCSPYFTFRDTLLCAGDCKVIQAEVKGGVPPYTYLWSNELPASEGPHKVCPDSTITYALRVTDSLGNFHEDSIKITVNEIPEVFAGNDTTITAGSIIKLFVEGTGESYVWSTGFEGVELIVKPLETTQYTVKATNKGCSNEDTITVVVEEPLIYIPNAFTPDGDGVNDVFKVYGTSFETFEMNIFNRWGELLFKTNNINDGWNGQYLENNTRSVKQDVYVYLILIRDFNGKAFRYLGRVTLIN